MKIALKWLADYLPGPLDAQAAADALTHGGLPVEVIETVADDTVIDVEVTSNRGDCLSHVGVARELAALLNRPFKDVMPACAEIAAPASAEVAVRIEAADLCPHYTARLIKGVKIGPSPAWMQKRLEAIGLRSINNVVDVTNYVMFELGQPLHAFDYDVACGGTGGKQIVVRRATAGEKLTTIDGKEATLQPDYLAICNATTPIALAGVMGGLHSEVSAKTVNILLESARFDPLAVRKAARAIVRSDSSYRFERGIDPLLPEKASLRAAQLIVETAGGQLLSGVVSAGATGHTPKNLTLRLARLKQVLGVEFPVEQVMEALSRLGLAPVLSASKAEVAVIVPSYRLDINIEVDLVEEVARIIGYDKVPVRDEISLRIAPPDPKARSIEIIRDAMVAGGYFEAVTVGFVADNLATDFLPPDADKSNPLPKASVVTRKENAALRPSILPGLLESLRRNENAGVRDARLFEIGSAFHYATGGKLVEQQKLGLVGSTDLREVRGVVEAILGKLDANREVKVVPEPRAGYGRGASGRVEWGGKAIGHLGKLDKAVADKLGLRERPCIAELEVLPLLAGAQHVPQLKPLPQFPPAERDLSLVVSESVRYEAVESLVKAVNPPNLESASFVTTYRGKPLEKGTKSVTLKLIFRSPTGTLTSDQVEQAVSAVVEKAKAELGATLRV
ncbi:phenylalanine--tRNA ligase subunit beta [Humisphaera borealis]|uniref:Phenylalanine--tRNA ligase beta subunit n=1 Tax=Humisphaera borealis TaxID=2807512 RepID=A0A7M2X355_9BACT|nr:phenylalanine--tRNA ligase subunit beta [Humisphaera borealis]QOV92196.1 phenylalanine--tRNA ligase subunit beta [Humisphaera borealis]